MDWALAIGLSVTANGAVDEDDVLGPATLLEAGAWARETGLMLLELCVDMLADSLPRAAVGCDEEESDRALTGLRVGIINPEAFSDSSVPPTLDITEDGGAPSDNIRERSTGLGKGLGTVLSFVSEMERASGGRGRAGGLRDICCCCCCGCSLDSNARASGLA